MADAFKKFEDKILSDEVRHDERKIVDKREDMNEHIFEEDHDKTKLMKDIREAEIRHDERVIDREEKRAEKHEEKIKENEQAINGVE